MADSVVCSTWSGNTGQHVRLAALGMDSTGSKRGREGGERAKAVAAANGGSGAGEQRKRRRNRFAEAAADAPPPASRAPAEEVRSSKYLVYNNDAPGSLSSLYTQVYNHDH